MNTTTLAERFALLRSLAGDLSQRELSTLAGLATTHVGAVERGEIADIELDTAIAISNVTGCDVIWLCKGTGRKPRATTVRQLLSIARDIRAMRRPSPTRGEA